MSEPRVTPEDMKRDLIGAFAMAQARLKVSGPEHIRDATAGFLESLRAADYSDMCNLYQKFKVEAERLMGNDKSSGCGMLEETLFIYDRIIQSFHRYYFEGPEDRDGEIAAHIRKCELVKRKRVEIEKYVKDVLGFERPAVCFSGWPTTGYFLQVYTGEISYEEYRKLHEKVVAEICKDGEINPEAINIASHSSEGTLQ